MAERSAAQKRATAKLVALNRRLRREMPKKSSGGGGGGGGGRRRHIVPVHGVVEAGGGALVAYGLLQVPGSDGGKAWGSGQSGQGVARYMNVVTNAKDVFLTGDPYWAPTRQAVYGGAALWAIGRGVKKLVPSLHRLSVKLGGFKLAPV